MIKLLSSVTVILFLLIISNALFAQNSNLKILTINVWSGLDYVGIFSYGEYETENQRELRFQALLKQINKLDPDVIFIQEANPIGRFSSRLADAIDFDEIHQVCIAGIKFGPLGIPSNLKEGMVILARKTLRLEEFDAWKLSGSFGLHGDLLSIHFDESIFALAGKIKINDEPIYLINVHLSAAPPFNSKGVNRREEEVNSLMQHVSELSKNYPVILAGDFNITPESEEIQSLINEGNFCDTFSKNISSKEFTWDARTNSNISFSTQHTDVSGELLDEEGRLSADYDSLPRRIDYIFLNDKFSQDDVIETEIVLDSFIEGVFASDHFGVYSKVNLNRVINESQKEPITLFPLNDKTLEPLPILSYDTDVGFGYGVKAFFLNYLGLNESFDMVLFNSTKGERWYRFVFSIPDFELRQGKVYPFALDLIVDYDKWIKNSFFGIGNNSKFEDREFYTREPLEISLTASRGFSQHFVGQVGLKFKSIRNFNFSDTSKLVYLPPKINSETARYTSLFLNLRYDTRNSFINPSRGLVLQAEVEYATSLDFTNSSFTRLAGTIQHYSVLFYPKTVLALRLNLQGLIGDNLPVQTLLSIGGNNTLRGYPQDRFLDKISAVANAELRFPIFWRFGGIAGVDVGRVWNKFSEINLTQWTMNPNIGLRFYMDTFIVRLDVGFGKEITGFYFNFGHMF